MEPINLHPRFYTSLETALRCMATDLGSDLLGACVVGSSICGDWDRESDLDLVMITRERVDYDVIIEMEERLQPPHTAIRVQLINLPPDLLCDYHLANCTTMAHSIRCGLVVLDRGVYFEAFKRLTAEDLPRREWIKDYFLHFCQVYHFGLHWLEREKELQKELGCDFEPDYPNDFCRAIVNFSILYLELHGIIPTTKRQIIRGLSAIGMPDSLIIDVSDSMYIRREDRQIDEGEANRFGAAARELMERLQVLLNVSDVEVAEGI